MGKRLSKENPGNYNTAYVLPERKIMLLGGLNGKTSIINTFVMG